MGTSFSRSVDLASNEYCKKFTRKDPISINDPFWNRFLAFNITPPATINDQLALESKIETLCQDLIKNNLTSRNFSTLIKVFLERSSELLSASDTNANLFNWQIFNTLFAIRCILKFLSEIATEGQLIEHIEPKSNENLLENFIGSLVGIIVDIPVDNSTYYIHLEAVTCLLILLSVQLHSGTRSDHSDIYRIVMKGRHVIHAPVLVKCLIVNFSNQQKAPPGFGDNSGQSLVIGLASDLWSMLTFSKKSNDVMVPEHTDFQEAPLATQSLLLVLVLVHHWMNLANPYRLCLFSCVNEDNNPIPPTKATTLFKIDFNTLYVTLYKKASGDAATLLLYLLLHRNQSFRDFLLARLDLDQLIVPLLKTLYNAPISNSHHIYMSLIILLILSEDNTFNRTVHETKLKNVTWYTERALTEVSMGGLLILVLIRTVQYNMLKMRDKYLHTNCLATLANMSSQFRDLHPYVSQRLVSLFETLAKKYQRLLKRLNPDENPTENNETAVAVNQDQSDAEQDLTVLEEVLRMILEIINSCLASQLTNNPNLIYTLLYNKHVFETFKGNKVFEDIVQNVDAVIQYFSNLLVEKGQSHDLDTYQVLAVIQAGASCWPKERLRKFPDLKFKFVEEDQPEEFFVPYVWELVGQQSVLHWTDDEQSSLLAAC